MADVLAVRDDYRAQTWRMLIQECSNSGLTKREFCRRRGISEKSFYYWLRKLRSQMAEAAGPQIVPLESPVISTEILQIQYRGAELKGIYSDKNVLKIAYISVLQPAFMV